MTGRSEISASGSADRRGGRRTRKTGRAQARGGWLNKLRSLTETIALGTPPSALMPMARQHVSEPVPTQSPHVHYDNAIHICQLILEDTVASWSAAVEFAESCYNSEPAWQPWAPAGQSAGAVSHTQRPLRP